MKITEQSSKGEGDDMGISFFIVIFGKLRMSVSVGAMLQYLMVMNIKKNLDQ